MSNNNNHQLGEAPWFHVALSTGFGVGFWPWGPGTLGGFVALLTWIGLYLLLSPMWLFVATLALVVGSLLLGVWTDMSWSAIGARIRVLSSSMSISERGWHVCLPCLLMVLRMWLYRSLRLASCCSVPLTSPSRSAVAGWTSTYMAVGAACWTMLWLRFMPVLWCLP